MKVRRSDRGTLVEVGRREFRQGEILEEDISMTGKDLIKALKSRGEWGSYFTYDGYEFVKDLRTAREICIALRAWGAADASESDSEAMLAEKLHRALGGDGKSPLSHAGPPGLSL